MTPVPPDLAARAGAAAIKALIALAVMASIWIHGWLKGANYEQAKAQAFMQQLFAAAEAAGKAQREAMRKTETEYLERIHALEAAQPDIRVIPRRMCPPAPRGDGLRAAAADPPDPPGEPTTAALGAALIHDARAYAGCVAQLEAILDLEAARVRGR